MGRCPEGTIMTAHGCVDAPSKSTCPAGNASIGGRR